MAKWRFLDAILVILKKYRQKSSRHNSWNLSAENYKQL